MITQQLSVYVYIHIKIQHIASARVHLIMCVCVCVSGINTFYRSASRTIVHSWPTAHIPSVQKGALPPHTIVFRVSRLCARAQALSILRAHFSWWWLAHRNAKLQLCISEFLHIYILYPIPTNTHIHKLCGNLCASYKGEIQSI